MRRRQAGFTLVEMLIAISVSALLVSLVYGAVRIGQRSAMAADRQLAQTEALHIGWRYLEQALERTRPVQTVAMAPNRTGFAGGINALTFVADMPSYGILGGLMQVTLSINDTPDGGQLLLSQWPLSASGEVLGEAQEAVLVDVLAGFDVDYFGRKGSDEAATWHTDWEEEPDLPTLVRIRITPADADAWPVLTARLAAPAEAVGRAAASADDERPVSPAAGAP